MGEKTKNIRLIIILVILVLIIASVFGYIHYSKLSCYEKGVCKKGEVVPLEENVNITINEVTCRLYNGNWQDINEECHFKK